MRDLYQVITEMLKTIPAENESLIVALQKMQISLSYAAPELKTFWWNECADLLNKEISDISESWQKELGDIFAGKKSETQ